MESVEVEVKFRCDDLGRIKKELLDMKANYIDTVDMVDVYFQHPCRDFKSSDEALRVRLVKSYRTGEEIVELTYKGPRIEGWAKSRVELIVKVNSFMEVLEMLGKLGFSKVASITKHREFYLLDNVEVSLDNVEGLGSFVELEDRGAGENGIRLVAEKLGLNELVHETYLELYLKKFSLQV